MEGYVHSVQSMGTVDGPGVRTVIFGEGCPLRCIYCHNPDTFSCRQEDIVSAETLCRQVERFIPYIRNGGVTFSGGEPCLQAAFFTEVARTLHQKGLHIALDTSGAVYNAEVEALLDEVDLVLLDVKMTTEDAYERFTGGSLRETMAFLDVLEAKQKPTWIRHVVVPSLNDCPQDIRRLVLLLKPYRCIERVELLPFRSLCREKYRSLGLPFALSDIPDMRAESLAPLTELLPKNWTMP